jgi:hypothetical protein
LRTKKTPLLLVLAALFIASFNAAAAISCAPQVQAKLAAAPYKALNAKLAPHLTALQAKLDATKNQAAYVTLLAEATAAAGSVQGGRVVITLPDGTVVVDTKKTTNSYANFNAKKINENHNSRIAILDSQLFECGVGVETKRSSSDNTVENYVAVRLGKYLDNSGSVRISKK